MGSGTMIGDVLVFLKNHLNEHLKARAELIREQPGGDKVVFVDGDKMDPLTFAPGAVTALLINVEEERTLRAADPYIRVADNGGQQRVQPDIRMNLYVLFVARFKQYEQAWHHLSQIIQYFQSHRVLDHQTAPHLEDAIERLTMELVTLEFAQQNEVWNALRASHHPSILYRVKLVVFRDREALRPRELREAVVNS